MKSIKQLFLTILLFSTNVFATGEYTIFECTSSTNAGDVVIVSGCITPESDGLGVCADEGVSYVTVTKEYWAGLAKMTPPVIETLKVPASYFNYAWGEDGQFSLSMNDKKHGTVELNHSGPQNIKLANKLVLKTKSFNHSFKVVGCEFFSSPME